MNIVDVVKLARKSNIRSPDGYKLTVSHMSIEDLQRFAKLVVEAERERCIKVCKDQLKIFLSPQYSTGQPLSSFKERFAVGSCIDAIKEE
jgi:hypothetical protein